MITTDNKYDEKGCLQESKTVIYEDDGSIKTIEKTNFAKAANGRSFNIKITTTDIKGTTTTYSDVLQACFDGTLIRKSALSNPKGLRRWIKETFEGKDPEEELKERLFKENRKDIEDDEEIDKLLDEFEASDEDDTDEDEAA